MQRLLSLIFIFLSLQAFSQSDSLDKYILTPKPSSKPHINGAEIFGVRPESPVLYKIPATGDKPLSFKVKHLPKGLSVDENTGIIKGALKDKGNYIMEIVVSNKSGKDKRTFTIKAGDGLGLTPPMGWNSWNCWGRNVNQDRVMSSAKALIEKGLIDYGWSYINIDDGWESSVRDANGNISSNAKFPNIKALSDWLHSQGLKFGIYSSPGKFTCAGFPGSYKYELQDARVYSGWGVDYLKYDWCSYNAIFRSEGDTSIAGYIKPYKIMEKTLRQQKRDIYYSFCQYGMKDVWRWGTKAGANSWRTTGDIEDTWDKVREIWEAQAPLFPYAGPGHWNDPDMLVVGVLGWGDHPHLTKLTPDEQYSHISLWCLLSAPLLIGCDISKMDNFTKSLLTNYEVLALDQDTLGRQAQQIIKTQDYEIWVKQLEDGAHAVGIFNLSDEEKNIRIDWKELNLPQRLKVRDLWRQENLGLFKKSFNTRVGVHGVCLIKVK